MSSQLRKAFLISIIFVFLFTGCASSKQLMPTVTPTNIISPTNIILPTLIPTNTPHPTNTRVPTSTLIPTSTKSPSCDPDQTIKNLKSKIFYDEFVVFHNKLQGTSFLVVWFVDPEINPTPKESEISPNAELAIRDALVLSQELNASTACIGRSFDMINVIVVDKNYNGWFSGQINTSDLPTTTPTDEELDKISERYQIGYLRDKTTAPFVSSPSDNCSWIKAKENIHNHFSPERENVSFYFVLDDTGVNIWAQWDSNPEFLQLNIPVTLMNIGMEVDCLFPQPDRLIFNTVDEDGEIRIVGVWNGADMRSQNISQIEILYEN